MTNVLRMTESNSYETDDINPNLNDQQQFRINKINEIKDCFVAEIKKREFMRNILLPSFF